MTLVHSFHDVMVSPARLDSLLLLAALATRLVGPN